MPAGAPEGNQNAAKAKRWTAAIERVLEAWPSMPTPEGKSGLIIGLEMMAYEFVKRGIEKGDMAFFKEFGDRIEGKVATIIGGDAEHPLTVYGWMTKNT